MIDSKDREILAILQQSAVTSKAEIARRVGLTPTAVFERIRKQEERGTIRGYAVSLDPEVFGLGLLAFVRVVIGDHDALPEIAARLRAIRGVEEVHRIAGEDDLIVKLRVADTTDLARILNDEFKTIDSIRALCTSIALETLAEGQPLPLDGAPRDLNRGASSGDPPDEADVPLPSNLLSFVQAKALNPS